MNEFSDRADTPGELTAAEAALLALDDAVVDAILEGDTVRVRQLTADMIDVLRSMPDPDEAAQDFGAYVAETCAADEADGVEPRLLYERIEVACALGEAFPGPIFGAFLLERAVHPSAPHGPAKRLVDLDRAAALCPEEPFVTDRICFCRAACLSDLGRTDEAVTQLRLVDLGRADVESSVAEGVATALGSLLLPRGDEIEVVSASRRALALLDGDGEEPDEPFVAVIVAAHFMLIERYRTGDPTPAELRATATILERFRPMALVAGVLPAGIDLACAVACLGTEELDAAAAHLDRCRVELERDEPGAHAASKPDSLRATYALLLAQLDIQRGDLAAFAGHLAAAGPLVMRHGDDALRRQYAGLLTAREQFGALASEESAAELGVTSVQDPIGRAVALMFDARRRISSGKPATGLSDELLAAAEELGDSTHPQYQLSLLYLAAMAVVAERPPQRQADLLALAYRADRILEHVEVRVDELRAATGNSLAAEQVRVFAIVARCLTPALNRDPLAATHRLLGLRAECVARGATLLALATGRAAIQLAVQNGQPRLALGLATEILDELRAYEVALPSTADRQRHGMIVADVIRDAFDATDALGDPRAVAELLEVVRAQQIPVVPARPSADMTPLTALVEALGDGQDLHERRFDGDEPGDRHSTTWGGAKAAEGSGAVGDEHAVSLLGAPPGVRMPWGTLALAAYRLEPRRDARYVDLVVPR